MAMQTDVEVSSLSATGTIFSGRARLKGITISFASGGTVVIRDGGASGATIFSYTAPAAAGTVNILIPAEGVLFYNDAHATLTGSTIVAYYG
jgi:hypothetical protein